MIAAWLPTVSPLSAVNTIHLGFVTENDTIHLAYRDGTDIKYIRSDNEGRTFTAAVTVATGSNEIPLTQCIACNGQTVHVAYLKNAGDAGTPPSLYYRRSTDAGATWGSEVTLDPGTGDPFPSTMRISLVAHGSYAHIFWSTGAKELRYSRSTNDGANWSAYVVVDASAVSERPEAQLDGENIHLTWTDLRHGTLNGGGETYYTKSTDRGVTWGASQRITNTSFNTARPTVAATGSQVVLAWQWPIFTEDIIWTYSSDGGATWAAEQTLTNPADNCEHASLQYAEGVFAITYTNLGTGVSWVQLSRDGGVTWETAQQPYTPTGAAQAPLLQFTNRFLVMMDRDNILNGTKLVRSPVFESEPSTATLRDDFNRADDPTPPPGTNWTNGVTTFGASDGIVIVSNQACRRSTGAYRQGGYWNQNNFTDMDTVAELSAWTNALNNGTMVFGRLVQIGSGTTDGYAINAEYAGSGFMGLLRITNGASTQLTSAAPSFVAGDKIALSCRGDLIIGWHQPGGTGEWTQLVAAVDVTYASSGRVGLEFLNNQNTKITNLWATEVHELVCDPGAYLTAGEDIEVESGFSLEVSSGNYAVTGSPVTFLSSQVMTADPGVYTVTGVAAELATQTEFAIFADNGVYTVGGQAAGLIATQLIEALEGTYAVTGRQAGLALVPATQGGVAAAGDRTTTYAASGDRRADP